MSIAMSTSPTETSGQAAQKLLAALSSLTYQQKQLVRDGEYSAVLHHILRQRRKTNLAIAAMAFVFGYFAVRTAMSGSLPWFSLGTCACFSWWVYSRVSKERATAGSMRPYTDAGDEGTPPGTLATELRLNHSLSYDQLQLLKQGKATEAAESLAAERRKNGTTMLFWVGPLAFKLILLTSLAAVYTNTMLIMLVADFLAIAMVCIIVVLAALRELRIAKQLLERSKAVQLNSTDPEEFC